MAYKVPAMRNTQKWAQFAAWTHKAIHTSWDKARGTCLTIWKALVYLAWGADKEEEKGESVADTSCALQHWLTLHLLSGSRSTGNMATCFLEVFDPYMAGGRDDLSDILQCFRLLRWGGPVRLDFSSCSGHG